MKSSITRQDLSGLKALFTEAGNSLNWPSIFVLPTWLQAWWEVFGAGNELFLLAARADDGVIGIAPFITRDKTVSFLGSPDVCDYLDFILAPGREKDFFDILLDHLVESDAGCLELGPVREDSTVITILAGLVRERGYSVEYARQDVSLEMDLPPTWDDYLALLNTKQRHEVRRKLRRLPEAGSVAFSIISNIDSGSGTIDVFLKMFTESREDKAAFMSGKMEIFFRRLVNDMAGAGFLRLCVLTLDAVPAAMTLCFDYKNTRYLYNSGYDPAFNALSVGIISKVLGIRDCIGNGIGRFDFLKGAEPYKYQLGGREVPIYNCRIIIR